MKSSATCSQCGNEYTYPADLDEKTGMHCASCGVLIHVKTGLPFGEAPSPGKAPENTMKKMPALPPVKRKDPGSGRQNAEVYSPGEASARKTPARKTEETVPAVSWLAWGLALIALILAFIFPSYGNDATDTLYMLQRLPSIIFGCTAAILFIQGMAAARR